MLTRKPRKGDRVRWPDWPAGRVALVIDTPEGQDNLCWISLDGRPAEPFIWRFREGLNALAEIVGAESGVDGNAVIQARRQPHENSRVLGTLELMSCASGPLNIGSWNARQQRIEWIERDDGDLKVLAHDVHFNPSTRILRVGLKVSDNVPDVVLI